MSINFTNNDKTDELVDNFRQIVDANASIQLEPYMVHIKGRNLKGLFKHNSPDTSKVTQVTQQLHKCRCCASRIKEMFKLSDKKGSIILPENVMSVIGDDFNRKSYEEIQKVTHTVCRHDIVGFVFLHDSYLYNYQPMEGGFKHFHINISEENQSDTSFALEEYILFEGAITRYIVQKQMCRLIDRLVVQGPASLQILESCLQKVAYGDKFLMSVRWAKTLLEDLGTHQKNLDQMNPKTKFIFYMKHLLNGTLAPDLSSGTVCYECQTLAQLVELMEVAKNEKAMMSICEDRLNPTKYQRPTAPATAGQVSVAMKHLGDFTISVAKISSYPNAVLVGVKTIKDSSSSAMNGFTAQMDKACIKEKKSTFADRCIGGIIFTEVNELKTIKDVINFIKKHPEVEVQINTTGLSPMYLAETTLSQDKLCVPFMWSFINSQSPSLWNMSKWSTITHIIPIWESLSGTAYARNAMFIIKDAKMPSNTEVCTFPEFLSSEYTRTCRTAFEGLKKTMKLIIPTDEPLAFGVGTSSKDENHNLYTNITLKILDIEIIISKLR